MIRKKNSELGNYISSVLNTEIFIECHDSCNQAISKYIYTIYIPVLQLNMHEKTHMELHYDFENVTKLFKSINLEVNSTNGINRGYFCSNHTEDIIITALKLKGY